MPAPFGTPGEFRIPILQKYSYWSFDTDISASVTDLSSLKNVWLALHIAGGQVLLPLAVLTFIFAPKSASRHRYITLVNFCVSWIVYSLVYCLLYVLKNSLHLRTCSLNDYRLYSGQVSTTPDAPSNLCIAQASLIHGAPPMWDFLSCFSISSTDEIYRSAVAGLEMVLQVCVPLEFH